MKKMILNFKLSALFFVISAWIMVMGDIRGHPIPFGTGVFIGLLGFIVLLLPVIKTAVNKFRRN